MKKYYVITLFVLGLLFRLVLIQAFPQPYIFDQTEYHQVALGIMKETKKPYVHTYRMYGYPMLIAILYSLFGVGRLPLEITQTVFDTLTAVFVFFIAQKIFKKRIVSWTAYILYLFNPFTSAYVGVFLTEITATFLIALIIVTFLKLIEKKKVLLFILLGFILSYLPQVKPAYLFFSLFVLFCLIYQVGRGLFKLKNKAVLMVVLIVLYIIPFFYNIVGNLRRYQQFAPLTVDNLFVREFYISLFIDSPQRIAFIPAQVNWIYQEYSLPKTSKEERKAVAYKYFQLAVAKVKKEPEKFITSRLKKMWFVWEKHSIFPFNNPKGNIFKFSVYWGNVGLLILAVYGFINWLKKEVLSSNSKEKRMFAYLCLFLFVYISTLHAFSITDERFSLPFYPFLFLFVGFGIWLIVDQLKVHIRKNK